jgi:hypothetical protein
VHARPSVPRKACPRDGTEFQQAYALWACGTSTAVTTTTRRKGDYQTDGG